jgi:antitoxin (DNA-binding transcriptional repressor) of toxin-antitoxin stability system
MRQVPSDKARRTFREILNDVEYKGEHVEILRYITPAAVIVPVEWHEAASADLSNFRVAGYDDEAMAFTQPVEVRCGRCGESRTFTYRDDGGADYTESLAVLVEWARSHHCKDESTEAGQ